MAQSAATLIVVPICHQISVLQHADITALPVNTARLGLSYVSKQADLLCCLCLMLFAYTCILAQYMPDGSLLMHICLLRGSLQFVCLWIVLECHLGVVYVPYCGPYSITGIECKL